MPGLQGAAGGQLHALLPQPLAHGRAATAQPQACLGVAQRGAQLVTHIFVIGQGLALLRQFIGVLEDLRGQRRIALGQVAYGGIGGGSVLGGQLHLLHLLLQLLAAALGNALGQPGGARHALQQLAALGLQLGGQQALAGFDGGLLFLAQRQLQQGAAVLCAAPCLAGLGEVGGFAGLGGHGLGVFLGALLEDGQIDPPRAGLRDQVGLVGRGFFDAHLECGDGIALIGQQAFQHFLAGVGGNAFLPAIEQAAQLLVAQRRGQGRHGRACPGAHAVQFLGQRIGFLCGRGCGIELGLNGVASFLVGRGATAQGALQGTQRACCRCGLGQARCQQGEQQAEHQAHGPQQVHRRDGSQFARWATGGK